MLLKRLAIGAMTAGVVISTAGAAMADGMPGRSVKDAPYVAPYSWTGFYGGANLGGAWIENDSMVASPADAGTAAFWGPCNAAGACPFNRSPGNGSGAIGGLQFGYNLQFQSFLVGIEADIQGSTARTSHGISLTNAGTGFVPFSGAGVASLEWLGTVRARLGFLLGPSVLAYATGGLAYGEVGRTWGQAFPSLAGQNVLGESSSWETGWTAGGGLEYLIAPRVTLGAEYLYVALPGDNFSATAVPPIVAGGCTLTNCNFNVRTSDLDIHIARLKVNFKF
jgi:outer membrane immunogenic protein